MRSLPLQMTRIGLSVTAAPHGMLGHVPQSAICLEGSGGSRAPLIRGAHQMIRNPHIDLQADRKATDGGEIQPHVHAREGGTAFRGGAYPNGRAAAEGCAPFPSVN